MLVVYILVIFNHIFKAYTDFAFPCITPRGGQAYCVSLFACPSLMRALGSLDPSVINYVRQSICLGCEAGDFMVCCAEPQNLTISPVPLANPFGTHNRAPSPTTPKIITTTSKPSKKLSYKEFIKKELLPTRRFCGYQHKDDRYYNNTATAIDEFPWLVHIRLSNMEYEEQYADRCSGVLISIRYVLTDAYCGLESIKVKLGEYNTNKNVTCVPDSKELDCTNPTVDIAVEEIIRQGESSNGPMDFVLLRLVADVQYSDFIRPICLPLEKSKRPQDLNSLVLSGWGAPNSRGVIKKRLTYDVALDSICFNYSNGLDLHVKKAKANFICTSPFTNSSGVACGGDRGGPFMYETSNRRQWFVEGVIVQVMFSEKLAEDYCNNKFPIYGLRITERTINWILASIRP